MGDNEEDKFSTPAERTEKRRRGGSMREFQAPLIFQKLSKQELQEEITNITQLQNLLMNIGDTTLEYALPILKESEYYKNYHLFNEFMSNVYFAVEYHPESISELAQLTKDLVMHHEDKQHGMVKTLIKWGIYSHLAHGYSPLHSCRLCFIRECLEINLIHIKTLVIVINSFWKTNPGHRYHLCRLFIWFAPQILMCDPTFFMHLHSIVVYEYNSGHLPEQYASFLEDFEALKENDWKLWNFSMKHLSLNEEFSISKIIKTDNLEKFKEKINSTENFDINQQIKPHYFEPCWFVQNKPTLIQYAAYFKADKIFNYLLENNADINITDTKGNTLIDYCVAGNNIEIFKEIKDKTTNFENSLHIAALFHHYSFFDYLQRTVVKDIHYLSKIYGTVVKQSVKSNNLRIFQLCIQDETTKRDKDFFQDVMLASSIYGSRDILHFILAMITEVDLDVNKRDSKGLTLLHNAANIGHFNIVHELLSHDGIDANARDPNGDTALHIAARNCDVSTIIVLLMSDKVDVNVQDSVGNTALHIGSLCNCLDVVKTLIKDPKIDPNITNQEGDAPIHIATRNPDSCGTHFVRNMVKNDPNSDVKLEVFIREQNRMVHIDILRCIAGHPKTDLNKSSAIGWSPLHYVARYGHYQLAITLYECPNHESLDVNIRDRNQRIPLHIACESGRFEIACFLINPYGCDINAQDMFGQTPLHKAVLADNSEITHMLSIKEQTDLNIKDKFGRTPLMIAAIKGRVGSIRPLARNTRIDLDLTDSNGLTALQLAIKNDRKYCATLLRLAADLCELPNDEDNKIDDV